MLKFLRTYNKIILVVFGAFLMVVFLVPHAEQMLRGDPTKRVVATLDGRDVQVREIGAAAKSLEGLRRFYKVLVEDVVKVEGPEHWFLLVTEAKRLGLVGGPSDGREFISQDMRPLFVNEFAMQYAAEAMAEQIKNSPFADNPQFVRFMAQQRLQSPEGQADVAKAEGEFENMLPALIRNAAASAALTEDDFLQTLADMRGVVRLLNVFGAAPRYSDRRLLTLARDRSERAIVDMIRITPDLILHRVAEPTEEQLAAHFAKYQSVDPGKDVNGIGYLLEPRVKLEALVIDREKIAAAVEVDPVEVRKSWLQNRATYTGEFAAERARIEGDLKGVETDRLLTEVERVVQAELIQRTGKLPVRDGYKILPTDWETQRPRMTDVAKGVVKTLQDRAIKVPEPTVIDLSDRFYTAADLRGVSAVSSATLRQGNKREPLATAVLNIRELGGPQTAGLQAKVPFDAAALADNGDRVFVNVLDWRERSPAESLADVREQAVHNTKMLAAFETLKSELVNTSNTVLTDGLTKAAELYTNPNTKAVPTVSRSIDVYSEQTDSFEVNVPEFRGAVMAATVKLDPLKPAIEQDVAARTVSTVIEKPMSVVVAQIVARRPLTREQVRLTADRVASSLSQEELPRERAQAMFTYAAMRQRLAFTGREVEPATPETPAADNAAPAAATPAGSESKAQG